MNKDKDNSNKSGKGKRGLESPDKGLPSDKKSCLYVEESAKESVKQTKQEDPMEVFTDCVDDSENVGGQGLDQDSDLDLNPGEASSPKMSRHMRRHMIKDLCHNLVGLVQILVPIPVMIRWRN